MALMAAHPNYGAIAVPHRNAGVGPRRKISIVRSTLLPVVRLLADVGVRALAWQAVLLSLVGVAAMVGVAVVNYESYPVEISMLADAPVPSAKVVRRTMLTNSGGGTTPSTCTDANAAMGSELFAFSALWLQKYKNCPVGSDFTCSAAFDASGAGSTESYIIQVRC